MTSFFYVVSIAFHTSFPALWKCMDTCRKKFFWLRAQTLVYCLLCLFIGPERLASLHLFEQSKDMKVTGGERVSITFPADGYVQNFFGFGEEVWLHSVLTFLVSSLW